MSTKPVNPEVGMGVTARVYTDSHALTITRISPSGKTFWATQDKTSLDPNWKPEFVVGGFAGHCVNQYDQKYEYQTDPDGEEIRFSLGKDGKWKCQSRYSVVQLGIRRAFHDYNF